MSHYEILPNVGCYSFHVSIVIITIPSQESDRTLLNSPVSSESSIGSADPESEVHAQIVCS